MNDAWKTPSYKENRVGGGEATLTNSKGDYYVVENALWGWSLHTGRYFGGHKSESVPFLLLKRRRRKNKPGDFSQPLRNPVPLQQSHSAECARDSQNHSATFPQEVELHLHTAPGLLAGSSLSLGRLQQEIAPESSDRKGRPTEFKKWVFFSLACEQLNWQFNRILGTTSHKPCV